MRIWLSLIYKISLTLRIGLVLFLNPQTYNNPSDDFNRISNYFSEAALIPSVSAQSISTLGNNTISLVFPFIYGGAPVAVVRVLNQLDYISMNTLTLVSSAKVISLISSFVIDIFIYKIAKAWYIKPNLTMCLYGTWFGTFLLFCNSSTVLVETILLVCLYYIVVYYGRFSSHLHHEHYTTECNHNDDEHQQIPTNDKATILIGVVIAIGVMNRLTFIIFAFAPVLQWVLKHINYGDKLGHVQCCGTELSLVDYFHVFYKSIKSILRLFVIMTFGSATCAFFISFCDSVLAGKICLSHFDHHQLFNVYFWQHNITFSPENFMLTYFTINSLRGMVTHPYYTHGVINIPLMFGPLGIMALYCGCQLFSFSVISNFSLISERYWLFLSGFCFPLVCLSIYPHQRSDHLGPLIIPLVFISCIRLSGWSERIRFRIVFLWAVFNLVSLVVRGILLNGQIINVVNHVYDRIDHEYDGSQQLRYGIFFVGVKSSPSEHLFVPRFQGQVFVNHSRSLPMVNTFDDWFGLNKDELSKSSFELKQISKTKLINVIYIAIPGTFHLCSFLPLLQHKYKVGLVKIFHLHISPQKLPSLVHILFCHNFVATNIMNGDELSENSSKLNSNIENEIETLNNVHNTSIYNYSYHHVKRQLRCNLPCSNNYWTNLKMLSTLKLYKIVVL